MPPWRGGGSGRRSGWERFCGPSCRSRRNICQLILPVRHRGVEGASRGRGSVRRCQGAVVQIGGCGALGSCDLNDKVTPGATRAAFTIKPSSLPDARTLHLARSRRCLAARQAMAHITSVRLKAFKSVGSEWVDVPLSRGLCAIVGEFIPSGGPLTVQQRQEVEPAGLATKMPPQPARPPHPPPLPLQARMDAASLPFWMQSSSPLQHPHDPLVWPR